MPTDYCGATNNYNPKPERASHLKKPEPVALKSFERLVGEMCESFGKPGGEAARHAVLERMGIEPAKSVALDELRRYVEPKA